MVTVERLLGSGRFCGDRSEEGRPDDHGEGCHGTRGVRPPDRSAASCSCERGRGRPTDRVGRGSLDLGGQEAAEALEVLASMERRLEQTRKFYLRLGMQCYDMLLADERPDAGKILTGLGDWLPNATALHPEFCGNGITAKSVERVDLDQCAASGDILTAIQVGAARLSARPNRDAVA